MIHSHKTILRWARGHQILGQWFAVVVFVLYSDSVSNADNGVEFFEKKIRPVLVEHCYQCHGAESKELQGKLRLDVKAGWQLGGESGKPAVVPGKPDESPLIRAGLAKTPETSQFTSAFERIQAAEPVPLAPAIAAPPRVKKPVDKKLARHTKPQLTSPRGAFLSPLELAQTHAEETHSLAVGRASHRGCLSMDLPTYLQLLDWTGRQIRSDKRGEIPAELAPVLEAVREGGQSPSFREPQGASRGF